MPTSTIDAHPRRVGIYGDRGHLWCGGVVSAGSESVPKAPTGRDRIARGARPDGSGFGGRGSGKRNLQRTTADHRPDGLRSARDACTAIPGGGVPRGVSWKPGRSRIKWTVPDDRRSDPAVIHG